MKITKITKEIIHYVETDEEDYNTYIRHSAKNWGVIMGESEEVVYDCEELEVMFQEIQNSKVYVAINDKHFLKNNQEYLKLLNEILIK